MADGSAQSQAVIQARRAALGLGAGPGVLPPSALRAARPAALPAANIRSRDRAIFVAFVAITISVTFLQCFGVPLGTDAVVAMAIPVTALSLALLCLFVTPRINPLRFLLYILFAAAVGGATGFFTERHSAASLALLVILYAPFALSFPTSEANLRRCLNFFSNVMVLLAVVEFVQHAIQIAAGPQAWPNIYDLLPSSVLISDFQYLQPLVWRSHFDKPQAFVFLEVSLLSQYVALALAIEVVMFQRMKRIALFTAALFATFAGTGLLLIAVTLPVLVGKMSLRRMLVIVAVLLVIALIAGEAGWIDTVASRLDEVQKTGTSGNNRFMQPLDHMVDFLSRPGAVYSGIGAGQIEKGNGYVFWPIAKVVIEYGVISGGLFYAYFIYALFDRSPSRPLAFTLLLWFTFEGELLTAVYPITCVLLSTLFLVEHERLPVERFKRLPPIRSRMANNAGVVAAGKAAP